jgi:Rhodanese-related sulfurtransferase
MTTHGNFRGFLTRTMALGTGGPLLAALLALLTLAPLSGCQNTKNITDRDVRVASLREAADRYRAAERSPKAVLFIDPRPASEYRASHIAGARHIELGELGITRRGETSIDPELDSYGMLMVYGTNPGSAVARAAAKRLLVIGYDKSKVRWYQGGLSEWNAAGLPIESAEQ